MSNLWHKYNLASEEDKRLILQTIVFSNMINYKSINFSVQYRTRETSVT